MHVNLLGVFDNVQFSGYVELRSQPPGLGSSVKMYESEYDSTILSGQPRLVAMPRDQAKTRTPPTLAPATTPTTTTRATTTRIATPVRKRR